MLKECSKCHVLKKETEFYKSKRYKDKLYPYCKACSALYSKNYMREYRKRRKAMGEITRGRPYKSRVMAAYGGVCSRCGFSDIRALTLHHKFNNGASHRKSRRSGEALYRQLHAEGCPQDRGIIVLCANCHMINDSNPRGSARETNLTSAKANANTKKL